jgi:hypothetical protein
MTLDDLFPEPSGPRPGAAPARKCRRHNWIVSIGHPLTDGAGNELSPGPMLGPWCLHCGKDRDVAVSRRSRTVLAATPAPLDARPEPLTILRLPGEEPYPFPDGHRECGFCQDYGYTEGLRAGREAATPAPLDVERLARALEPHWGPSYLLGLHDVTIHGETVMACAAAIAAAYAEETK